MKISLIADSAVGKSGPHRHIVGVLNSLSRINEINLTLLTGEVDSEEPYFKSNNIKIITGFNPHKLSLFFKNIQLISKAAIKCDLIYVPTGLKTFLYTQLFRRRRKLVAGPNVTGIPPRIYDPHPFMVSRMCDGWIEASQSAKDTRVRGGNRPDDIIVIHHSIDLEKFNPRNRDKNVWGKYKLDPDRKKILFSARIQDSKIKGGFQLINSFLILRKKIKDADLVLAGSRSDELLKNFDDLGNIYPLGFLTGADLVKMMANCDIFVAPSIGENFPFVVLEAMASGVAVVASNVGGIKEQIINGESGILVDLRSPDYKYKEDAHIILADVLQRLLEDDEKRKNLGINARVRAEKFFGEERMGKEFAGLFKAVLEGKRQP